MPELTQNFDDLYRIYSALFPHSDHVGATRAEFMKAVPKVPNVPGVYLVWRKSESRPLYIGSSGKCEKNLTLSGQTVRQRLFGSSTPYHFDAIAHVFRYGPTTTGVPPAGYTNAINLANIRISILATRKNIAPSALEHMLIQGYINQHHDLPEANQKI
jgi:hypothetical protein